MSLRRFQGWEPTTSYEYDGDRLVRSVSTPEWDEEQQGWMLALAEYEADQCSGCGNQLSVSTATDQWGRIAHAVTIPAPARCHACDALEQAQKDNKSQRPGALRWGTVIKP